MTALLTKSRLSAARRCQRLHDILYIQGYRTAEEAAPLYFGTLVHEGLEQLWRGESLALPTDANPYDLARAVPMLAGYAARWDMAEYEVLAVEQEFDCDLVNPATGASSKTWRLAGKLDAIVREKSTGRVLGVEHKTSSQDISPGSTYWARLSMDAQVSIYVYGLRSLGYDAAGMIYDVLGKPGLRVLQPNSKRAVQETPAEFQARIAAAIAENPAKFYARGEVVRLESEMADAMVDVWQSAQQLREAERLGRSPRNPDACENFNRLCGFFSVCSGSESLDNERLYRRIENVHPELTQLRTPGSTESEREVHQEGAPQ